MRLKDAQFDIAVIGAGIAGASIAAELSADCRVLLLEAESQPGYHTTGRSAAIFTDTYGPSPIRALTRASAGFFHQPPAGFSSSPLLAKRGAVMIAREDQFASLDDLIAEVSPHSPVTRLDASELQKRAPLLRQGYAAAGMYDQRAMDIDVHALHHGYLRLLKARDGELVNDARVEALSSQGNGWMLVTKSGKFFSEIVINAAGAWAGEIGQLAGASEIGLVAKRRTVVIVAAPGRIAVENMPLLVDVDEQFYLKPESGRLLISPADEVPSPPCDAQPEELDIAICIDRIETAFDLKIGRVENKWAGLRCFVADKCPVVGFDDIAPGFFWLAGQGGYGIQSAPALSRFAAALVLDRTIPGDIIDQGVNRENLRANRPALIP